MLAYAITRLEHVKLWRTTGGVRALLPHAFAALDPACATCEVSGRGD